VRSIRRRLADTTGGLPVFPLVVLFLLFFFDEFDTGAFNVLAPNIMHAFHLSDRAFGLVVVANLSIVFLLAVPVGYYGDRVLRRVLVVVGGIVAGVFSLLTGLVTAVGLLVLVRIGNGIGRLVNDPIHTSLLADYYRPGDRPRVFGVHRNAPQLGLIAGSAIAGLVSWLAGWRVSFAILIVPIVITALVATRLTEPGRGATDDPDSAAEAAREAPVPFREATRYLFAVKTLKRQYWAWVFIGAGLIPLAVFLPLYLERVYHLHDAARGLIVGANAAFTFAGVQAAGRWTQRWLAKGLGEPLRNAGLALAIGGAGLLLVAASPFLAVALIVGAATSFVFGVFTPPFVTVQALVSPARVRTLSFSFGAVFLFIGGAGFFFSPLGRISDQSGIRYGVAATMPWFVIGGLVLRSAWQFVTDDTAAAFRTLTTTVELRRQRLAAGERSLLLCTGVDVAYEAVQVLFEVDLEVQEGEIVALLGTNGAGKSTLLKAISGLVDPVGGAIFFDGEDVTHADPGRSARLGIVQMPGGRSVFPTLTVGECLRLAGWMYKRHDAAHVRLATEQVLQYFPVLRERHEQLAGNLSGGEQQMLGLAMAFISKPRLLMIDELSLGLAPAIVGQLVDIVQAIHAQGTTIILVEQSVNVALTLASRAVFMEKGEVRFTGPTAELLEREDILRSVFLQGAAATVTRPKRAARNGKRVAVADAPPVLEVTSLVKRFGGIRAVDDVDLTLHAGEILGLIGPNGAGKTTIFDLISGFLTPDAGRIIFEGQDVTTWAPQRRSWAGLGRSFQDARLFPSLTVAENIAVALERHLEVRDPLADALGLPSVAESEIEVAWTVHELIELLGLEAFRNKFVSELSTGSRRIVDLAMSIAHQPSVLILDEPSSGIAQRETEALGPLLLRIKAETGCSLLLIEHDMPLVLSIADTLMALELGHVVTVGKPAQVVKHPEVVRSYLGTEEDVIARSGRRTRRASARRPQKDKALA
jgi:branched-chain amino acid transport system ATP-binding protein